MYDLMPFFFGGIMSILGLVMVINPKGPASLRLEEIPF